MQGNYSLVHLSMGRVCNPSGVYVTIRAYTYTPGGLRNPWGVYVQHAGCTYTRGGSVYICICISNINVNKILVIGRTGSGMGGMVGDTKIC